MSHPFFCAEITVSSPEYKTALCLRDTILRQPLGLAWTQAERDAEIDARHLACFAGDRLVGILLLTPLNATTVRMRQVAIAEDFQRRGVGTALVTFAEGVALGAGFAEVIAHAREEAVPFYRRLGYAIGGEPFVEVSIPHRNVRKVLAQAVS